jgi:hypothetical protein
LDTEYGNAAYLIFIISSNGAGIAYLTGEGAEETVENMPGISESIIEQHEDFAMYALISLGSTFFKMNQLQIERVNK